MIDRVNQYAVDAFPGGKASLVFDSVSAKINRYTAISVTNFLYRHGLGKTMDHILEFPLFADSLTTPGLQIADLAAYCINSHFAGRRGYLDDVFQGFRALTKNWHDRHGNGQTDYGVRFINMTERKHESCDGVDKKRGKAAALPAH